MTANEYQIAAMRTAAHLSNAELFINGVLGLCGESGEIADILKKFEFQGHDFDCEHIAKELGDVAWYLAIAAMGIGYDLDTIFQMNVDKLMKRYPDGFSVDRSLHRQQGDI